MKTTAYYASLIHGQVNLDFFEVERTEDLAGELYWSPTNMPHFPWEIQGTWGNTEFQTSAKESDENLHFTPDKALDALAKVVSDTVLFYSSKIADCRNQLTLIDTKKREVYRSLIGLTVEEAITKVSEINPQLTTVRAKVVDNQLRPILHDFNQSRLNVSTKNGKIECILEVG